LVEEPGCGIVCCMTDAAPAFPKLYFVAGEASGDRHAADLLRQLKVLYPTVNALGVGGQHLRAAGQNQLFDLAAHAVVGLTEVLKNYFKFRRFFHTILEDIERESPDALILVDYPGFNLRLAKAIKEKMPELKIIYYISPQLWAWKAGRSKLMARTITRLLVIFQFEVDWFERHEPSLDVEWVGHPLMDRWKEIPPELGQDAHAPRIALLPGSRSREIKAHLPIMLGAAEKLGRYRQGMSFIILAADPHCKKLIEETIAEYGYQWLQVEIHTGYQLTHLSRCDLALVASGTATVECCVAGVPMLVVYKVSALTFWVGRRLVKVPYLGMVNILAKEKVVPEFLQENANEEALFEAARRILDQPAWQNLIRKNLKKVSRSLGEPGASLRAAKAVKEVLESSPVLNSESKEATPV